MPMEILPSIDLRAGRVVRLKQGDYARQIDYDVDPVTVAREYAAAGASWIHIVDLDGAKEGRPMQTELIGAIVRSTGLRAEVGGGIRSGDDVQRLIEAGVSRVVVGTRAFEDWNGFKAMSHAPAMRDRIVLAVDARDGIVATRGWMASSGRSALDVAREASDWPLAALLYTDVAKDGMLSGPNFEQTHLLAQAGNVPVIASGGVGSIEHVRRLTTIGVWGAIIGRSLYEGTVDLAEAIKVASGAAPGR